MKQITFFILIIVFMAACATAYKINNVSIGMTKNDVIQKMGNPKSTSSKGNVEYLNYKLTENGDAAFYGWYTDYFVRLVNGRVESYGKLGDFNSTKDPTINVNTNSKVETKQSNQNETDTDKMYHELNILKELLDKGIINQEEFDKMKKDILEKYK
ncbi:MAG: SHOCT domain-containing protein [Bacteroidales bacterium]|nr:SHOCT domain-containing protein [Bacteroidales bacterium]